MATKRASNYLIPVLLLIAGSTVYALGFALGDFIGLFRVVAIVLGFAGLLKFEEVLRKPDAHMLQLGLVALLWLLIVKLLVQTGPPFSASYLFILAGCAGTAAFFQRQINLATKKLIYGLFVFLVALPALLAVFSPTAIDRNFGESASDVFIFCGVLSGGAYAAVWFLVWQPRGGARYPPVDS